MRVNDSELNEVYHINVIDVNVLKENIFYCNRASAERSQKLLSQMERYSISKEPVGGLHRMEGLHPSSNQYQYLSDVSNSKELQ